MATQRITSIDALRTIVLFGILLVHTSVVFSFVNSTNAFEWSRIGYGCNWLVYNLLQYKCNKIFGMLFGISFYLILKNPTYSPYKFVWRCVLLIGIGLLNKIFYTVDALMWYGICGMVLVLFRNFSNKWLFVSFCCVFLISSISRDFGWFVIKLDHSQFARYTLPTSLNSIMAYPVLLAAKDYFSIISHDPFSCLWQFLIGYYFAKKGIIDNLQKYIKMKSIIFVGIVYVFFFILKRFPLFGGVNGIIQNCTWLSGAIFYAMVFLWLYYRFFPKLRFLEAYGKLGLTNYSLQGIIGVVLAITVYIPNSWGIEYIYLASIVFFVIQLLFSNFWLRYFTNGPLEWAWRCLTNLKYTSPVIKTKK